MTKEHPRPGGTLPPANRPPTPDSESDQARRRALVATIQSIVAQFGYSQTELQGILGQRQPEVSKLLGGKGCRFSAAKLMGFIEQLGGKVDIDVTLPTRRQAPLSAPAAASKALQ